MPLALPCECRRGPSSSQITTTHTISMHGRICPPPAGRGGNERHAGPKPYRRRDGKADDGHLRFFLLPPGSSQIHWQNIHFSQRRIPSRHRHSRKSANRGARVSMASRSLSLSKLLVEPRVRIDYYVNKIRIVGLGWTVRWIARRIAVEIMWVGLLPITVLEH